MADVMKIALAIIISLAGAFAVIRFFRRCGGVDEQVIGLLLAYGGFSSPSPIGAIPVMS